MKGVLQTALCPSDSDQRRGVAQAVAIDGPASVWLVR
jgi:hypothetical protein